jgi:AcrR family transcriptional regulator
MANQRVINGKNTFARIQEELQKLRDSNERISVAEFARRVGISPQTLAHHYKDAAEEVRRLRDEARTKARKRSPASLPHDRVTELEQAVEVIAKLRLRVVDLEKRLSTFTEKDNTHEKWELMRKQLRETRGENERLRGVIVSLQQEIMRHMPPELSRRIMKMIEKHAATGYASAIEQLAVEDDQ